MKTRFFDLDEIGKKDPSMLSISSDKAGLRVSKFIKLHYEKVESIRQLTGRLPLPGEMYKLWTINSFNAYTFLPFLIDECEADITELIISTFSFNTRITNAIGKLISEGKVKKVTLFVNEGIKTRNSKDDDQLTALVGSYPSTVKVIYAWNHSKISLIQIAGHYFIVDGSGNFGENAQFEQYSFWDDQAGYEFYKNAILYATNR
jgi:hypothetical protein